MSDRFLKVAGFCPMGCGETLFLGEGGFVTCSKIGCPSPDAVSTILADRETEHVVKFDETTFTIKHPLKERLGDQLMSCHVYEYVAHLGGPPVVPGVYRPRVIPESGGHYRWEPVR